MFCNSISCPLEKFYKAFPGNAGCVHCRVYDHHGPVTDCGDFRERRAVYQYKIKARSKSRTKRVAVAVELLLKSLDISFR